MRHRDVQQRVDGGTRYRLDVERLHDGAQILLQLLGTAAPAIARGRGPLGVLLEELVDKRHTPVIEMTKIILVQQDEAKVFKDSELSYSCYSLELAPGGCTAPSHLQLAGPGQNLKRDIQNGAIFFFVTLANYEHCRSWHGSRDLPV